MDLEGSQMAGKDKDATVERVAQAYAAAVRKGNAPSVERVCSQYPGLMPDLRRRIEADLRVAAAIASAARRQAVGEPGVPSHRAASQSEANCPPPVLGPYDLGRCVGRGGFGAVYEGTEISSKRRVAVKVLYRELTGDGEVLKRFQREAQVARRLRHANIVRTLGTGLANGVHFLAMEYVDGIDLHRYARGGTMAPRRAVEIVAQAAKACHHAHQQSPGVVHRDIKPANILIENGTGRVVVTDFGLAKEIGISEALTGSDDTLGTINYMAPEQADRRLGATTALCDVYSLGATLYHLLTGRPPFPIAGGITRAALVHEIVWDRPARPSKLNDAIPKALDTICLKCLQKSPLDRYPSAADLADDLIRFAEGKLVTTKLPGPARRIRRWAERRPALAGVLAGLLLSVVAGAWLSVFYAIRAHRSEQKITIVQDIVKKQKELADQLTNRATLSEATAGRATTQAAEARAVAQTAQKAVVLADSRKRWEDYVIDMREVEEFCKAGEFEKAGEILARRAKPTRDDGDLRGIEWYYWDARVRHAGVTLRVRGDCRGLAFSPDGRYFAASNGRQVTVWDFPADTLRFERDFDGADTGPDRRSSNRKADRLVAFSPDSRLVAVTTVSDELNPKASGSLGVWDVTSGNELLSVCRSSSVAGRELSFSQSNESVLLRDRRGGCTVFDLKTKREQRRTEGDLDTQFGMERSIRSAPIRDGVEISRSPQDFNQFVHIFDASASNPTLVLRRRPQGTTLADQRDELDPGVTYTAMTYEQQTVVAATVQGVINMWRIDATTDRARAFPLPAVHAGGNITSLALSADRRYVASGNAAGTITVQPTGAPSMIRLALDPPALYTGSDVLLSDDGTLVARHERPAHRLSFERIADHSVVAQLADCAVVSRLCYDPGVKLAGAAVYGANQSLRFHLLELDHGRELAAFLPRPIVHQASMSFSADGSRFAVALGHDGVGLWRGDSQPAVVTIATDHPTGAVALSPSGRFLAAGGPDGFQVFELPSADSVYRGSGAALDFVFDPTDAFLCVQRPNPPGENAIVDLAGREEVPAHLSGITGTHVVFSDDGRRAYAVSNSQVHIYSTTNWVRFATLDTSENRLAQLSSTTLQRLLGSLLDDWRRSPDSHWTKPADEAYQLHEGMMRSLRH